jgi:hypothetical protein
MRLTPLLPGLAATLLSLALHSASAQTALNDGFARDSKQPIDQTYTDHIRKYTTDPQFSSRLVDYLPASATVPTPAKVLGDVAGAPDMLPYAEDVYKYFRQLESASPRVKVFSIGHTEENREMIAVAIADPALLQGAKENGERLAKLADPRTIGLDDSKAQPLIDQSYPVYYITGTMRRRARSAAPDRSMRLPTLARPRSCRLSTR